MLASHADAHLCYQQSLLGGQDDIHSWSITIIIINQLKEMAMHSHVYSGSFWWIHSRILVTALYWMLSTFTLCLGLLLAVKVYFLVTILGASQSHLLSFLTLALLPSTVSWSWIHGGSKLGIPPRVLMVLANKDKPGLCIKRRPRTTSHPQLNLAEPLSGSCNTCTCGLG